MKNQDSALKIGFAAIALGLILTAFLPSAALAHPPKDVAVQYNADSQKLIIKIDHSSSSPSRHYISRVEVKLNGENVLTKEYKNQPDKNPFEYEYIIPTKQGDSFEVKVVCNIYGKKTIELKIPAPDKK